MFFASSILTALLFVVSHATIVESANVSELPDEYSLQIFRTKAGILETTFLGSFNTRLYFLGSGKESQYNARQNCKSAGMELVTFAGPGDLSFVQSKLSNLSLPDNWFWMDSTNVAFTGLQFSKTPGYLSAFQTYAATACPYVCIA